MDTRSHYDKYTLTLINIMHIFLNVLIQICMKMWRLMLENVNGC